MGPAQHEIGHRVSGLRLRPRGVGAGEGLLDEGLEAAVADEGDVHGVPLAEGAGEEVAHPRFLPAPRRFAGAPAGGDPGPVGDEGGRGRGHGLRAGRRAGGDEEREGEEDGETGGAEDPHRFPPPLPGFGTRFMPHFGQRPGASERISGCMGQV